MMHKVNKENFVNKSGICYEDKYGNEYTYEDFYNIFLDEKSAEALFDVVSGKNLEETLEDDWCFRKCKRCGNWNYNPQSFMSKHNFICNRCTPVRTHGSIKLLADPYDDDRKFYTKRYAKFKPGLTTLIGCNGVGKTTLLQNIHEELQRKGVPNILFDNLSGDDGGTASLSKLFSGMSFGDEEPYSMEYAVSVWASSEGERIKASFIRFLKRLVKQIRRYKGYGEFWILFDALDSGLSLDVIEDIKGLFVNQLLPDIDSDMNVYVILSSNSYEMSEHTNMFAVEKMAYVSVKTYARYKYYVLSSAKYKAKRDEVFAIKAEIANRDFEFSFDEDLAADFEDYETGKCGVCATMILSGYKMELILKNTSSKIQLYKMYRMVDGEWKCLPNLKNMYPSFSWRPEEDKTKEEMHEYLCKRIFLDRKKTA